MVNRKHQIFFHGTLSAKNSADLKPTVFQMTEQDFINRILYDLRVSGGKQLLRKQKVRLKKSKTDKNYLMRLYQPVHRTFHPIILEAYCNQPGEPRIDPQRILKAGIVIRRKGKKVSEGWVKTQGRILGWQPVAYGSKAGVCGDPDPEIREKCRLGSNDTLLRTLELDLGSEDRETWQEDYIPLFPAPPETCKKAGKTLLYGILNLTSNERPEPVDDLNPDSVVQEIPITSSAIIDFMSDLLKHGDETYKTLPYAIHRKYIGTDKGTTAFMEMLKFLAYSTGLFTGNDESKQLKNTLEDVYLDDLKMSFYAFLQKAYGVLIERKESLPDSIYLPYTWPKISSKKRKKSKKNSVTQYSIVLGIEAAMKGRWEKMNSIPARYDESTDRYTISCFLRVKDDDDCPPRTIWTNPSEPFKIVPWFESSGQPPVQVELPAIDPLKPQSFKNLRPNVSFKVPPELKQFMERLDMNNLLEGKHNKGSIDFGMICGFNIPIITICAFLLLNIILSLLNIIFWWLPFVRICIPFPKSK